MSDASELQRILGGATSPRTAATREDRVRLLGEFAQAVLAGREPDRAAAIFLAGALRAWLDRGGSLEGEYLRVHQRGSHRTPQDIWREVSSTDERQAADRAARCAGLPSSTKGTT
jgi:hypothetical protein